jgi:hypothetical protein
MELEEVIWLNYLSRNLHFKLQKLGNENNQEGKCNFLKDLGQRWTERPSRTSVRLFSDILSRILVISPGIKVIDVLKYNSSWMLIELMRCICSRPVRVSSFLSFLSWTTSEKKKQSRYRCCCSRWHSSNPLPEITGRLNRLHKIEKASASIHGTDSTVTDISLALGTSITRVFSSESDNDNNSGLKMIATWLRVFQSDIYQSWWIQT